MNIDAQALRGNSRQDTSGRVSGDTTGLPMLVRQAAQGAQCAELDRLMRSNPAPSEEAHDTTAIAVKYSMIAPEIEGDTDDGELAIPTPFPMPIMMYVDFPTAPAPLTPRQTSSTSGPTQPSARTSRATTATDSDASTPSGRPTEPRVSHFAPSSNVQSKATAAGSLDGFALDNLATMRESADGKPTVSVKPADGPDGATPIHTALGHLATLDGASYQLAPKAATAPHAASPSSQPASRGAQDTSVGSSSGSATQGGSPESAAGVPSAQPQPDSVEMVYRFSSWGPTESVALKLDGGHVDARMLATASNGYVHKMLDNALRHPAKNSKGRLAVRLASQSVEGEAELPHRWDRLR